MVDVGKVASNLPPPSCDVLKVAVDVDEVSPSGILKPYRPRATDLVRDGSGVDWRPTVGDLVAHLTYL